MRDPDDLLDPAENFTFSENAPFGARIPEYAFRQLVGYNLRLIRQNIDNPKGLIDENFNNLPKGEIGRIKEFFREHPNIQVTVNFPGPDAHLPLVSVINQGETEDERLAFLGDRTGTYVVATPNGPVVMARTRRGVGQDCVTRVAIGTQDPDLTMYLHHVVKLIFFANKGQLTEFYDVHNLIISSRDLQIDTSKLPQFGFYKELVLRYKDLFEWIAPEEESEGGFVSSASVGLLVDALKDGEETLTPVPGEQG